jgi:hypothetical protein
MGFREAAVFQSRSGEVDASAASVSSVRRGLSMILLMVMPGFAPSDAVHHQPEDQARQRHG